MTNNLPLFDRLVAETVKLSPTPAIKISKGHLKCWADLAAYWEAHAETFPNVFFEVIFHIARSKYSKAADNIKPLLLLIEEAVLTDLNALSVWKKRDSFSSAFSKVTHDIMLLPDSRQRWKSTAMRCYVNARLYTLLMYNGVALPELTLKTIIKGGIYWKIRSQLEVQSAYTRFEEFIEQLVPESRKWNSSQWASEKYILSQIKAIHGVDFSKSPKDFDLLARIFRYKAEGIPYYRDLFLVTDMPLSIAKAIWPEDMEKEICRQFNYACNRNPHSKHGFVAYYEAVTPENIAKSWAFRQMEIWRKSKTYTISKITRSKMMLISFGVHPWDAKHKEGAVA